MGIGLGEPPRAQAATRTLTRIRKRDGRIVAFDREKIVNAIYKAMVATGERDRSLAEKLASQVVALLEERYDGHAIPSVEEIQDVVERVLVENGQARTAKAYILYRQKRAEIRREKQRILEKEEIDEVDKAFDVNALRVLKARYLKKDPHGRLIETPKQLFIRVAVHAALPDLVYDNRVFDIEGRQPVREPEPFDPAIYDEQVSVGRYKLNRYHLEALKRMYDRLNSIGKARISWRELFQLIREGGFDGYEKSIEEFYDLMVSKRFLPNTPAIANFGNVLGMGSACFVLGIEDSIESIMDALRKTAIVFKAGGGMGYNFSKLRPEGDFVSSTSGVASGPISFMMLFDTMTEVIKQGGCVACDTLIRTDKGLLQIGELLNCRPLGENPTDYFVYDGDEYNHALLAQHNGHTEVYVVTTELGTEIKATWNHLVATVTEEGVRWKRVGELKKGDWVVKVLNGHSGREIKLPPVPTSHRDAASLTVPETLTTELAELLGLYMADGCFSDGRLIFSIKAEERDLLRWLELRMEEVFHLAAGERRDHGTHIDLVFSSKPLERYFEGMGWRKEDSSKSFVPKEILLSKPEAACGFIRGLFEGDGTIHPDGYPILPSSSKLLLTQVQQLLFGLGIVSRLRQVVSGEAHRRRKQMYLLTILTEASRRLFEEKIGFISGTKKKRWEAYARDRGVEYADLMEKFKRLRNDPVLQQIANEQYFFTRIVDIQKSDCQTMEIEVPASGCYVANGFLVHNIRRGANMGILNSNHPDVEKFVTAKKGNRALRNFNISVLMMPDFWECYRDGKPYPLINPRTGEVVREVDPRLLFDMIVYQAWESAEPGVIFYDNVNKYNPFLESLGPIVTTNPCGEVPLYPNESCNLGSINVWAFVREDGEGRVSFDWEALKEAVTLATRFLDNVIDVNKYPLKEIEDMALATRKIGLGVMGVADLLFEMRLPYNSGEGRAFMERLMEFINYWSKVASIELAKERGPVPYFDKSFYPKGRLPFKGFEERGSWHFKWDELVEKIRKYGIRNSYTTVIAPTGSISMIAGCSSGIEPLYTLIYEKHVKVGSFYYVDPVFERVMAAEGLFDEEFLRDVKERGGSIQGISYIPEPLKRVFVTAMDITPEDHVRALAAFQKWVDSSISKTTNFPAHATVEDMRRTYLLAYELGCKAVTVFRDTSIRGQVLVPPRKPTATEQTAEATLVAPAIAAVTGAAPALRLSSGPSNIATTCSECGSTLVFQEGCHTCPVCGWSACAYAA